MNRLLFALKRAFRPGYLVLLAFCGAAVILASLESAAGAQPPAGVYAPDSSEQTQRVVSYLTDNGFELFDDVETMYELVRCGQLDCAAILPENLPELLKGNGLEGCVRFISAPSSYAPGLYRNHLAAALFREYAPYLTAESFSDTAVAREEVLAEYEQMFEEGYAFSFELLRVDGTPIPADNRSRALVTGTAALLFFVVLVSSCGEIMGDTFCRTLGRLGFWRSLCAVVLPGVFLRALLAALVGGIALAAAGTSELVWAFGVYVLLLSALSLLLAAVLPDGRYLSFLLPALLILSAALCPIFTDLTLFLPALKAVRWLLPPYWLWAAVEHMALCFAAAVAAVFGALGLLMLRYVRLGRYRLKPITSLER